MRRFALPFVLALASLLARAATPVVSSGLIDYSTSVNTVTGSGFQPNKAKPTVIFNGSSLTVSTFNNTQFVANLPAELTPGTFDMTVTNSQGNSVDFDITYGATGLQGPAGAAGAAGPQGPRGLTGASGAPGPAGTNGVGLTFLNAYDAYATYMQNNVVGYNGSSYFAIVPNGPSPNGPTPDQNPSWSLMAAAGTIGAAGPAGPEGPAGLMGNPGPAGPAGPAGPQGPAGGLLSIVSNKETTTIRLLDEIDWQAGTTVTTNSITLVNVGTYMLSGAQLIENTDTTINAYVNCFALDAANNPILTQASGDIGPNEAGSYLTLPLAGYHKVATAPVTVSVECYFGGGNALSGSVLNTLPGSVLTAIQVQ